MNHRIGIPRALLYYQYEKLWLTFFAELGVEVISSGETNKLIIDEGAANVVDEACLPVKVFFGHALQLADKVDYIFVPRIVSVEKNAYICPKVMGLPDMLAACKKELPPLIKPVLNLRKSNCVKEFAWETGSFFTDNKKQVFEAWERAKKAQSKHDLAVVQEYQKTKDIKDTALPVLILGHHYLLEDHYLNMDLQEKLKKLGCQVITPSMIGKEKQEQFIKNFPRLMFWSYGRMLLGSLYCFGQGPGLKGVIIISSFACGIDSFIGNLAKRYLSRQGIPFIELTLDEHTGEAGLNTRIEAFIDMIRWRRDSVENYISSYGYNMGCTEGVIGAAGLHSDHATSYQ